MPVSNHHASAFTALERPSAHAHYSYIPFIGASQSTISHPNIDAQGLGIDLGASCSPAGPCIVRCMAPEPHISTSLGLLRTLSDHYLYASLHPSSTVSVLLGYSLSSNLLRLILARRMTTCSAPLPHCVSSRGRLQTNLIILPLHITPVSCEQCTFSKYLDAFTLNFLLT